MAQLMDWRTGSGIQLETQLCGKSDNPEHSDRVFAVTDFCIADNTKRLCRQLTHPMMVIEQGLVCRVVVECVDGEVATVSILCLGAEIVVAEQAS